MNTGEGTKRQWSTKHYTANYRFPNANALKSGEKPRCSGRVFSSFPTNDTHCLTLVITPAISHEREKGGIKTTIS